MIEILDMRWEVDQAGIQLVPVEVGTWKKATTGNGAALKIDVQHWVKAHFNYTAKSEDEADAIAIAEACRRIRRGLHSQ